MDNLRVTVAVTSPFTPVFEILGGGPPSEAKWEDLAKVEVTATRGESLREVLRRASDMLGLAVTADARQLEEQYAHEHGRRPRLHVADWLVYAEFRHNDDDVLEQYERGSVRRRETRLTRTVLVVRDEFGRAVWRRPGLDATIGELIDAARAGLMEGDPLQPYLIPAIPQGDVGSVGEWIEMIRALEVLWEVVEHAATAGGAWGFVEALRALRRRREGVAEVVRRRANQWSERGAAPADLIVFLRSRQRRTEEISGLLGCSDAEAEAVLWGTGFSFDGASGTWRYKDEPQARLIADDVDHCSANVFTGDDGRERLRDFATERLRHFLVTGEPPSAQDTTSDLRMRTDRWWDLRDGDG